MPVLIQHASVLNNLWSKAYPGDSRAHTGDPAFVDPKASTPEGYRLKSGSPAIDAGILLTENQLDFWSRATAS